MPRPTRSWVRKTYTVSPLVEQAIAFRAAEQGIDPGTVIDILVWNALVKPDEARLKQGGFTEEELERIFAEEVLDFLVGDEAIEALAEELTVVHEDDGANLKQVKNLVKRWRKTRQIETEYKESIHETYKNAGRSPSILECGCIKVDWLNPA